MNVKVCCDGLPLMPMIGWRKSLLRRIEFRYLSILSFSKNITHSCHAIACSNLLDSLVNLLLNDADFELDGNIKLDIA